MFHISPLSSREPTRDLNYCVGDSVSKRAPFTLWDYIITIPSVCLFQCTVILLFLYQYLYHYLNPYRCQCLQAQQPFLMWKYAHIFWKKVRLTPLNIKYFGEYIKTKQNVKNTLNSFVMSRSWVQVSLSACFLGLIWLAFVEVVNFSSVHFLIYAHMNLFS